MIATPLPFSIFDFCFSPFFLNLPLEALLRNGKNDLLVFKQPWKTGRNKATWKMNM